MTPVVASYRLQLSKDFTFYDAAAQVPYLRRLGVSHLYLSPVMECKAGSNHGYDVTDIYALSAARGGAEGFRALVGALGDDMRLIVDIVPNHMSAAPCNRQWGDVLKQGRESPFWPLFDIFPDGDGKIVLPVLAEQPEILWASGALYLQKKNGEWALRYEDMDFPLREGTPPADTYAEQMQDQHYKLAKWTEDAYTYRRFFHLKGMVALRVEDDKVAAEVHKTLFDLLDEYPAIEGLRVDHIDGLAHPARYLSWLHRRERDIWFEKILARGEKLPDWPIAGTTGYEFIDALNMLMVNRRGFEEIEKWWRQDIEEAWPDFAACLHEAKKEVIEKLFGSVFYKLAQDFCGEADDVQEAYEFFAGLTAALPVYRVYGRTQQDIDTLSHAVKAAEASGGERFSMQRHKFLARLLSEEGKNAYAVWQQISGGVMAKGLEDCAHYRYTPLAALNEVGCTPEMPARGSFTDFVTARAAAQPQGLNTTSTHDTKRSEDTRARLYALADRPTEWIGFYKRCRAIPLPYDIPAVAFHFFLQAVCGTWPLTGEVTPEYMTRLQDYMEKSAREESRFAHYTDASSGYVYRLRNFVRDMQRHPDFYEAVTDYMKFLAPAGAINSLSAVALKCLSPGVPDIYQGCDLWDFSLVDPDNRRRVDYDTRQTMLDFLFTAAEGRNPLEQLCRSWKSGAVKLWLLHRLLDLRRRYMAGQEISAEAIAAQGAYSDNIHACLFSAGAHRFLLVHVLYPGMLGEGRDSICLPSDFCADITLDMPDDLAGREAIDVLAETPVKVDDIGRALMRFPLAVLHFTPAEPSSADMVG